MRVKVKELSHIMPLAQVHDQVSIVHKISFRMYPQKSKEILSKLSVVGPEGMALAYSLIHGYAGIARGIDGHACDRYLADQLEKGTVRIMNNSWVYTDAQGTLRVGGLPGDKVIRGVARIGALLHHAPGRGSLDEFTLADGLIDAAGRVMREIVWRTKSTSLP